MEQREPFPVGVPTLEYASNLDNAEKAVEYSNAGPSPQAQIVETTPTQTAQTTKVREPNHGTVEYRLKPTLIAARNELIHYEKNAKLIGRLLNMGVLLQVLLGALITGVAAAASPHGAQVSTTILGGMSTLVASGLARGRGSGEPETSQTRASDLTKLVRKIDDAILDWGDELLTPEDWDERPDANMSKRECRARMLLQMINSYRKEYDDLISAWNGQRATVDKPVQATPPTALPGQTSNLPAENPLKKVWAAVKNKLTIAFIFGLVKSHEQQIENGVDTATPYVDSGLSTRVRADGYVMRSWRVAKALFAWNRAGRPVPASQSTYSQSEEGTLDRKGSYNVNNDPEKRS